MRAKSRPHLAALLAYCALILAILGPLHPGQEIWGSTATDVINHFNMMWWQANEVASGNLFPVKNCLIHYPDCGTLFLADFIGGTLMAPLVMVAGPIIAYNALIFADLLFSCWAMFWLIRRLTGDPLAAFVAGTIYGLSALNLGHMSNGVTETLQTGWLPLFLGALYALFDDAREPGHRKRTARLIVLAAAALWAVTVGGHWYQGVYASGLFVLLVAVHCFGPHRWRLLARSGALFGAFAVMILPVVLVFLSLLQSELSLTRGIVALSSPDMQNSADPGNFFSATAPIQKDSQFFLHLTYLGLSVPLLAMVGLFRHGRQKAVAGWLLGAALFAVLAMGPTLFLVGRAVTFSGQPAPLPFALLAKIIPFFGSMNFPYRFFLMVHLCLAMAAGVGLANLWPRYRLGWAAVATLPLLILLETATLSGALVPAPRQRLIPHATIKELREAPGQFAIMDLPVRFDAAALNVYMSNQVFHQRAITTSNFVSAPIPYSATLAHRSLVVNILALSTADSFGFNDDLMSEAMFRREEAKAGMNKILKMGACDPIFRAELETDLLALISLKITRFVVHKDLLPSSFPLLDICRYLFGPPTVDRGGIMVFVLKEETMLKGLRHNCDSRDRE